MRPDEVLHITGMAKTLGLRVLEESPTHVLMEMPVTDALVQPFGFLHGGATISLLESAASWAAALGTDFATERAFGSHIDVHHLNSVTGGVVRGSATLESTQDLGERGSKQTWAVEAKDEQGRTVSCGTITTRTVSLRYLSSRRDAE
ncbi:MAG: PaaI family thioesterase [Coriobacteriales bacterium]